MLKQVVVIALFGLHGCEPRAPTTPTCDTGQILTTECAKCGPTDACERTVEVCDDPCEAEGELCGDGGLCLDGVCMHGICG